MKKTKKFNPVFVVDLTNIDNTEDVIKAFIEAKKEAGIDMIDYVYNVDVIIPDDKCEEKKLPWYKRFWNWITRKK